MKKRNMGAYHAYFKVMLFFIDIVLIAISFLIASKIRLGSIPDFVSAEYLTLNLIILTCLFLGNEYTDRPSRSGSPRLPLKTLLIVLSSAIPCTMYIYISGPEKFSNLFGRGIFPVAIVVAGTLLLSSRFFFNKIFNKIKKKSKVLIIGNNAFLPNFYSSLGAETLDMEISRKESVPHNRNLSRLDAVVICHEHSLTDSERKSLLNARLSGTPILSVSEFFECFLFLIPVEKIDSDWFIRSEGFSMLHSAIKIRLKRSTDIALSVVLLLLSLPILVFCASVIRVVSNGPVIFKQNRVGLTGEVFTIYKLRTMNTNAEQNGAQWAELNDERAYPFGDWLRKTRLDELPQCWNILKGDMSFVGPRPERPEFTSKLSSQIPYYDLRHLVKPGLTGWAQVCYPYGASVCDALKKLQYDLYYIKNYSLLLDLNIILRTAKIMIGRKGR